MKQLAILIALVASLLSSTAFAQQQEVSPEMQAISGKLMREVSEGLQCQASGIKLAKENEAMKATIQNDLKRIQELEAKPCRGTVKCAQTP